MATKGKKPVKPSEDDQTLPQPAADNTAEAPDKQEVSDKTVDGKLGSDNQSDEGATPPLKTDPGVDDESAGEVGSANMPTARSSKAKSTDIVEMAYTGTAEKTYTESAYHPDSMRRPYNPDPLVQRDHTYRIYEEMLEDDQVDVAMQIKKDLVVGAGFFIKADDDQTEIKEDLEIALGEQCDRPFGDIVEDMCQSFEYGFSCGEKIFKNRGDGSLCLRDVKVRHPGTWLFHTDRQGNVVRYEQRGLFETIDVNPDSLLHVINRHKHQNPYGRSDLRSAYNAYIAKRHIVRMYAIFIEKAASPTPVAKYDRRAPPEVVNEIFEIIKKFQAKTAITIPKEFEIEFLEAKSTGEAFIKGINLFNMLIGRALFIPDLLGFQGSETSGGSFALGKDQIAMIFRHIQKRRATLERAIDMHIVKPIAMFNWGLTEGIPRFKFKELSKEDAHKMAEIWVKAINGQTWQPTLDEINHFRDSIDFPQSDDVVYPTAAAEGGTEANGNKTQPQEDQANPGFDTNGNPMPPDPTDPESGDGANGDIPGGEDNPAGGAGAAQPPGNKPTPPPPGAGGKGNKTPAGPAAPAKGPQKTDGTAPVKPKDQGDPAKKKDFGLSIEDKVAKLPGNYAKKTNFSAIDSLMRATVERITAESAPIVSDILEDLYDQMQKKKIIARQDLERSDSLSLKYLKRLQLVFKKNFRRLYEDAKVHAAAEVKKGEHAKNNQVPSDEFLDFLDQETFKYIGDWEYQITQKAKQEIITAIKDGKPLSEVISIMDNEGQDLSDVSIERYARTKSTEVFNRGRMDYFDSTGVVSAYQYAAILDDRTSDICEGLDGCIFNADDAPVPPMHFNCRSTLVPITQFEDYNVDEKANDGTDIDVFIDDNIGKGFPRS